MKNFDKKNEKEKTEEATEMMKNEENPKTKNIENITEELEIEEDKKIEIEEKKIDNRELGSTRH